MTSDLEKFAEALDCVLEEHRTGKLSANAVTYAISHGMNDDHGLVKPGTENFDEDTVKLINAHIENLREARQ